MKKGIFIVECTRFIVGSLCPYRLHHNTNFTRSSLSSLHSMRSNEPGLIASAANSFSKWMQSLPPVFHWPAIHSLDLNLKLLDFGQTCMYTFLLVLFGRFVEWVVVDPNYNFWSILLFVRHGVTCSIFEWISNAFTFQNSLSILPRIWWSREMHCRFGFLYIFSLFSRDERI